MLLLLLTRMSVSRQGAIVSFTKSLANMLMSTNGIRTNCVNPGPIWTVRGCLV